MIPLPFEIGTKEFRDCIDKARADERRKMFEKIEEDLDKIRDPKVLHMWFVDWFGDDSLDNNIPEGFAKHIIEVKLNELENLKKEFEKK